MKKPKWLNPLLIIIFLVVFGIPMAPVLMMLLFSLMWAFAGPGDLVEKTISPDKKTTIAFYHDPAIDNYFTIKNLSKFGEPKIFWCEECYLTFEGWVDNQTIRIGFGNEPNYFCELDVNTEYKYPDDTTHGESKICREDPTKK